MTSEKKWGQSKIYSDPKFPDPKYRAVQEFSPEYLTQCQQMRPEEILRFLDQFRRIHGQPKTRPTKSKLISLKVPEDLLQAFKTQAELEGVRYQTQIKKLMRTWLNPKMGSE